MGLCKEYFEAAKSIHRVTDSSSTTSRRAGAPHCEICNAS
jgi:hypothetical protein